MTITILGIDALDPDLIDPDTHENLSMNAHHPIDTIVSVAGEPSTHELWPTIITGLTPSEHGLKLDDGVTWGNPIFRIGSNIATTFFLKKSSLVSVRGYSRTQAKTRFGNRRHTTSRMGSRRYLTDGRQKQSVSRTMS